MTLSGLRNRGHECRGHLKFIFMRVVKNKQRKNYLEFVYRTKIKDLARKAPN